MARPPKYDYNHVVAVFRECGTQVETARRLGMHKNRIGMILREQGIHAGRGHCPPGTRYQHSLPMEEIVARYQAGENCCEVAEAYQVDDEMLRRRLHRLGIARKRPVGPESGVPRNRGTGRATGSRNYQWKGGKEATLHYHRRQSYEVAAICLGKPLPQGWVIHHLDEDPKNNRPENLVLFPSQSLHCRFHQRLLKLQHQGAEADAIQLALASGAQVLPPPPAPIEF